MNSFTIQIPDELGRALERLSEQENRPLGDLVRDSLERYVAVQRFKLLADRTRLRAVPEGFSSDDDVFEAIP